MAGMDSEITGVWVYEIKSGKNVRLELPVAEYTYHTNLSWSPDEKAILLQHLNRDQDHMSLRSYAIATGEMLEEILTESDKEYVEPLQPLIFAEKNQGSFYFQSARDGWNHLYYYDGAAKKLVQMTNGNWEVTGVSGYNRKEGKLYFTGTKDNPLERHFYSLEAGNKKIQKLSRIAGTHKVTLNSEKSLFIDDYSSFTTPHGIQVASLEDKDIGQELFQAENPLQDFRLGESVIGKIRSADKHTDLYYKMVLPVDFDSTRKYPVVFYVYGGPHIQLVKNSWYERVGYFGQYLAQHNVVFFIMDPRGTDGRGMEFEQIIHRQSGIPQMDDYLEGIEFLKSKSFIDQDRMGITGWSYGGYMTISMMLRHPGLFTAGVAGGPVTDWTLYEVMYGERYMDTPEQNPEGYEKTNLSKYAGDLKDDLLIIHGALDPVVVMQHSLLFMQACIENGSYIDFFVYPGHEHNVRGADRIHLTRMITNYFFDRFGYEHDQSAN
jgi:dipeptidyl aminopeptidase/acylaminoacyl peptidase